MRSGFATAGQLLRLDLVQLVVAAQQQRDQAAVRAVDEQRLDACAAAATLRKRRYVRDGAHAGRRDLAQRPAPAAGRGPLGGGAAACSTLAA